MSNRYRDTRLTGSFCEALLRVMLYSLWVTGRLDGSSITILRFSCFFNFEADAHQSQNY